MCQRDWRAVPAADDQASGLATWAFQKPESLRFSFLLHLCLAFCVVVPYFLKLSYPPEGPRYLHTPSSPHEIVKASPNPPKPSHDSLIASNVGAQNKGFTFVISTEAWIITRTSPQGSLIIWSLEYHTLILFFLKEPL